MKNIKLTAGLAVLLACLPLSVFATNPPVVNNTDTSDSNADLILGFRASGGTGVSSNLEVNLGGVTSFASLSDGNLHLVSNLSVNDLSATYGSNWATRSDLTWGVAGAYGTGNRTLFLTYAESTPGTAFAGTVTPTAKTSRNQVGSKILAIVSDPSGLNGATSTSNSAFSAVINSSNVGSWSAIEGSTPLAFGAIDYAVFENSTNLSGGSYVVSDLYQLAGGNGTTVPTYIGSFGLSASGLYFSSSASSFATPVPEPSTYAAIAGVLALGVVAWRRQQKKVAA